MKKERTKKTLKDFTERCMPFAIVAEIEIYGGYEN